MQNYLGNPFSNLKAILPAQSILDIAFKKAMKIKPPKMREGAVIQTRELEINRVNTVNNIISNRLESVVKEFPSINQLHPFYLDLIEIIIDIDELKKILGRIFGSITTIKQISQDIIGEMLVSDQKFQLKNFRKQAFGRISSVVYNLDPFFEKLEKIRIELSNLPSYNSTIPCIVVCGMPNVGKSSFIKKVTSGKPEVAGYPFTTKKLIFGHRDFGYLKIQFVDTPGLLDREIDERNEIELQAITALKHLADIMIYLIDLSAVNVTNLSSQFNLLREIKEFYPSTEFLILFTKEDLIDIKDYQLAVQYLIDENLITGPEEVSKISIQTSQGLEEFLTTIHDILKNNVIKSEKFTSLIEMQIDEDTEDEENLWFLSS
ncbi:MAG: 50S ribosome-binding GTPase [Candidatus Heimdallarchaeota archaeon]|nr:50S ribosome-binding GTPase [Candidatus Heimdallarchaeota archaeon]